MFVLLFDLNFDRHTRQTMAPRELSVVYLLSGELELPKMFMFRYYLNDINLLKIISIAIKYITPEVFLKSNTFIIIFILYIYMHPSNELMCIYKWRSVQTCFELDVTSLSRGIVTALHVSHT